MATTEKNSSDRVWNRQVPISPRIFSVVCLIAACYSGLLLQPGMWPTVCVFAALSVLFAIVSLVREGKAKRGEIRVGVVIDLLIVMLNIGVVVGSVN
ncbi:MAG: hypothetical protein KF805_12085 [Phycisphaeraceae bacterium]|nr:hypothetical protein [Phycisphaeraceae bacterium]